MHTSVLSHRFVPQHRQRVPLVRRGLQKSATSSGIPARYGRHTLARRVGGSELQTGPPTSSACLCLSVSCTPPSWTRIRAPPRAAELLLRRWGASWTNWVVRSNELYMYFAYKYLLVFIVLLLCFCFLLFSF
jgi:hypothetical protein